MILARWVWTALLLWPAITGWAAEVERFEDCAAFTWEMTPDPRLGLFRVYTSQSPGVYRIHPTNPRQSTPDLVIPAIPTMLTSVPCRQWTPPRPGRWYAVMTSVSKDVTIESVPSEEMTFTYQNETPVPTSDGVWVPPWGTEPFEVPAPLPGLPLAGPSAPKPPRPTSGDWLLSESCLWKGTPCPD